MSPVRGGLASVAAVVAAAAACGALVAGAVVAAPSQSAPGFAPLTPTGLPSVARRVAPALLGLRVVVPTERPSTATLGTERWGSAVVFDPAGYALTVSYVLLDAEHIEARLADGRVVPARLVGIDLESGLGVVKLAWPGPWPVAPLADSARVAAGDGTGTVGMSEDGSVVVTSSRVERVQPFTAAWEYRLERAFFVAPPHGATWSGAPLVNAGGEVIGVTSLRMGDPPAQNLVIPVEHFAAARDELLVRGRVESRRPRPWLGLLTQLVEGAGVVIVGVSPAGPSATAGFRRGDLIVKLNGESVGSQEEFYQRLWARAVGDEITLVVRRAQRFETVTVRAADRYRVYRTTDR